MINLRLLHRAYLIKLLVRSIIADWRLPASEGTIITGSVRSGTTLALRVYCHDLTAEEERDGSAFNEPQPFSNLILQGRVKRALMELPLVMANRHHLIKSTQIAFLLPYVRPKYRVIVTFRDLRMVIPSMLRHKNVRRIDLGQRPYWADYAKLDVPDDPISKAILAADQYYKNIAAYKGSIEVWNYGFWDEWVVRSEEINHLYTRGGETSKTVLRDVKQGRLFSNSTFTLKVWEEFCLEFRVTESQERAVHEANERIRRLYKERGLRVKTLDDFHLG